MAGKIAIYQVLPRLFGNTNKNCIPNSSYETNGCGKLDHFNQEILSGLKDFGYTHIWFTGIIRHASQTAFSKFGIEAQSPLIVKGKAGSPYAIVDYYDVSPDLSNNVAERMSEFEQLVDRCHKTGLKVIIDFVPNHVSRAYKSLVKPTGRDDFGVGDKTDYPFHPLNNFYYIPDSQFISPIQNEDDGIESKFNEFSEIPSKATGNDCFTPRPKKDDWYETVKLNYGVDILKGGTEYFNPIPDTWYKMRDILIYWAQKGVDGFRCDMAAMVPLKFWEWVIPQVKTQFHQLTFIAEIYEKNRYEEFINGGFDYLYDKVGLYDTLRALTEGNGDTGEITKCWSSLNGIEDKMLNFLENHDEQRVASDYFASDPFRAIPALTVALLLNRAPFLIYFGQELGERGMDSEGYSGLDGRTTIYDYWSVSSVREWIQSNSLPEIGRIYKELINVAVSERAVSYGLKYDLQYANSEPLGSDNKKIYSFMRKSDDCLLLIIVNFSSTEKKAIVKIPEGALDYFGLKRQILAKGRDILGEYSDQFSIIPDKSIEIQLDSYGVRVIKFLL